MSTALPMEEIRPRNAADWADASRPARPLALAGASPQAAPCLYWKPFSQLMSKPQNDRAIVDISVDKVSS